MPVKRDQLDSIFSEVVRLAANCCEASGEPRRDGSDWVTHCKGELECCHVHTRRISRLRHDPENIVVMCSSHHAFFTQYPIYWGDFVRKLRGDDLVDLLIEKKQEKLPGDPGPGQHGQDIYLPTIIDGVKVLDVAHHGSIGVVFDKKYSTSTTPPSPVITNFPPITYSSPVTSNPVVTTTVQPPFLYSTTSPIVVHSSSSTTSTPLVVKLLQKKNSNNEEGQEEGHYHSSHLSTATTTPLSTPILSERPTANSASSEEPHGGSFSSIFLSRAEKPENHKNADHTTMKSTVKVVQKANNFSPTSMEANPNDGFKLSLLVPCLDAASGQKKNCLLVKKGA